MPAAVHRLATKANTEGGSSTDSDTASNGSPQPLSLAMDLDMPEAQSTPPRADSDSEGRTVRHSPPTLSPTFLERTREDFPIDIRYDNPLGDSRLDEEEDQELIGLDAGICMAVKGDDDMDVGQTIIPGEKEDQTQPSSDAFLDRIPSEFGPNLHTPVGNGMSESTEVVDDSGDEQTHEFEFLITEDQMATRQQKYYTDIYTDPNGMQWRLLWFPYGNDTSFRQSASVYLELCNVSDLPSTASRTVEFELQLVNSLNPMKSVVKGPEIHEFTANASDWGYTKLIPIGELYNPDNGFFEEGGIKFRVRVTRKNKFWINSWNYNSKKETGMVGLKNQGATCYMNSLLQTLFHLRKLRRAVYEMPTEDEDAENSIPLALQRVFYRLQTNEEAVSTKELTKTFGWDTYDAFMQHDVQELNRVLCDKLEEKMKGTPQDGTIQELLEGKIRSFIKCVNVDYTSQREESFYDIQLDVKGCKGIIESFRKYVEVELLNGENQYDAATFGMQDAEKGVKFVRFPPILNIHLKRFEYDPYRDGMVKIHDHYEFPDRIQLDEFLTEDADRSVPNTYRLHSVLVHSGDVHGGHYYVYIRPTHNPDSKEAVWCKFDDDRVTRASSKSALDGNYGNVAEEEPQKNIYGKRLRPLLKSYSSAYMLVYVREPDLSEIMQPLPDDDIPKHLVDRFTKELEEYLKRKRAIEEAHLYMTIKIATDVTLSKFKDYTKTEDFCNFSEAEAFWVRRDLTLVDLKRRIHRRLGVPPERQRLWTIIARHNYTTRPETCVDSVVSLRTRVDQLPDCQPTHKESKYYLQVLPPPIEDPTEMEKETITETKTELREEATLENGVEVTTEEHIEVEERDVPVKPEPEAYTTRLKLAAELFGLEMGEENENGTLEGENAKLFAEEEDSDAEKLVLDGTLSPPSFPRDTALLFVKFYDNSLPLKNRLKYMGTMMIHRSLPCSKIEEMIRRSLSIPDTLKLLIYEEIRPRQIETLNPSQTLEKADLQSGDVIVFQYVKPATDGKEDVIKYKMVPEYFRYLTNRVHVTFRSLLEPAEEGYTIELLMTDYYSKIVKRLASVLRVGNPMLLRLTNHNYDTNGPRTHSLAYKMVGDERLDAILKMAYNPPLGNSYIMYYEVLKHPIDELEKKRFVQAVFLPAESPKKPILQPTVLNVLIDRDCRVNDLLHLLRKEAELDADSPVRLVEVLAGSIRRIFEPEEPVSSVKEGHSSWNGREGQRSPASFRDVPLILEELPEDEIEVYEEAKGPWKLLCLSHFVAQGTPSFIHRHGLPMVTYVLPEETLKQFKQRISKRLHVTEEEMSTWKSAVLYLQHYEPLEEKPGDADDLVLYDCEKLFHQGADDSTLPCLGFEHPDKSPTNYRSGRRFEQGIKIRG